MSEPDLQVEESGKGAVMVSDFQRSLWIAERKMLVDHIQKLTARLREVQALVEAADALDELEQGGVT